MATFTLTNATQQGNPIVIPSITLQSADVTLFYGNATHTCVYTNAGNVYVSGDNAGTIAAAISFVTISYTGSVLQFYTNYSIQIPTGQVVYAPSVVAVFENNTATARTIYTDYYICDSSASLASLKSGIGGGALIPDIPATIGYVANRTQYWYNGLKASLEATKSTQVKLLKPLGALLPYAFISPLVTKTMTNSFTVTSGANTIISVTFTDIGTCTFGTPLNQSNTSGIASALNAFLVANQKAGTASATNPVAGTQTVVFTSTSAVPYSASVRNNGTVTTKYFV